MNWENNKCGGVRFRTLPNSLIEIEGSGIPRYVKGSPEYEYLVRTWKNWEPLIRKHAGKTGIPVSNLLAIAAKETGLWSKNKKEQASMGSPAGAQGVMQVMPCSVFEGGRFRDLVCGRDHLDPDVSFNMGSVLLRAHLDAYGNFPAAASAYNAGGLKCYEGATSNTGVFANQFNWHNEHDYATKALTYNNTAVEMGVNNAPLWPWIVGGLSTGLAILFLLQTKRLPLPRRLAKAMS